MNGTRWLTIAAELATTQWGLFTTAQARAAGMHPKHLATLADAGAIHHVRHGIHRIHGAPWHPHEDLRAAWLALDPTRSADERLTEDPITAAVSHRSAAKVLQLGDVDADHLEFTLPRRRQTRLADQRFHVGALASDNTELVDGLPVTTAARTIDDLAADLLDGGHLAGIIHTAISTGRLTYDAAATILDRHSRRYGHPRNNGQRLLEHLLA
ncbi:type IV toxin-antitoxin system AbiEi family antitoxin domain-containing protein [Rhodococcus sp. PD04]|uniref:type IV toxin-antitoxin system AbiEi family antitoxin domain-containing protein n=1 Tax=Rhodococcus sp. PD04 TaxID=3109594 RepID=UPI002DDB45D5|nr:type IV toxin-antitoxin system AbiEi family antitoxin domain-containing protein [Rhodococcus sp. PD04]WSE25753.1 type IV toxin-antitoxin system AbiEi family antitoxin domain-containing protein [Rhodococcus sp. PD04]